MTCHLVYRTKEANLLVIALLTSVSHLYTLVSAQLKLLSVVDKSFKTSRPGSRRTSVSEGEQSQLSGETSKKPQTQLSSIVPFIQRLCSTVQPADDLTVQEGPLPQQKFVHYLDDPRGQFLGKYGRLLSYASNILCVSPEHLENEVRFIEEHLIVGRK
jgi:hypothetical protein